MQHPLISVIIPSHNRAIWLRTRSIPSVLRQSYASWELIVVGDGPPDNSLLHAVAQFHDPRIKYVEMPRPDYSQMSPLQLWHASGAAARNYGLTFAQGDIIAPLDDDDEFLENHLEDCAQAIMSGFDFCYGKTLLKHIETGEVLESYHDWNDPETQAIFLEKQNLLYHSNVCYSSHFRDLKYQTDGHVPGDYDLWLQIYHAGGRFTSLERPQSIYYGDSKSSVIHLSNASWSDVTAYQECIADISGASPPTIAKLWTHQCMWPLPDRWCRRLEEYMLDFLNVKDVISSPSMLASMMQVFAALKIYQPDKKEVILAGYAPAILAKVLCWCEFDLVFCDIDYNTLCTNPDLIECLISPNTSAIVVVHAHGNPCNMPALEKMAARHRIILISDATKALGSTVLNRNIGSFGDIEIVSFGQTEVLPDLDGSIICCQQSEIAGIIRAMRRSDEMSSIAALGFTQPMAESAAALALLQLTSLQSQQEMRKQAIRHYKTLLQQISALQFQQQTTQSVDGAPGDMILLFPEPKDRQQVANRLHTYNIEFRVNHMPLHKYTEFASDTRNFCLKNTEYVIPRLLRIPLYPQIHPNVIEFIADVIIDALAVTTQVPKRWPPHESGGLPHL